MDFRELKDAAYKMIERKRQDKNAAINKANDFFNGYQDGIDDFFKVIEAYEKKQEAQEQGRE